MDLLRDRKMGQDTDGARKECFLSGGYGVSEKASSNEPAPCSLGINNTRTMPLIRPLLTGALKAGSGL